MTNPTANMPERSGLVHRAKGKAKELLGTATGNEDLPDEGRLHQEKEPLVARAQREATAADVGLCGCRHG